MTLCPCHTIKRLVCSKTIYLFCSMKVFKSYFPNLTFSYLSKKCWFRSQRNRKWFKSWKWQERRETTEIESQPSVSGGRAGRAEYHWPEGEQLLGGSRSCRIQSVISRYEGLRPGERDCGWITLQSIRPQIKQILMINWKRNNRRLCDCSFVLNIKKQRDRTL